MHIQAKVYGHNSRFFGDGFAFWYAADRNEAGPVFGSKDLFRGLAIFFDTYANQNGEHAHEHPYISAQVGSWPLFFLGDFVSVLLMNPNVSERERVSKN